MMLACTCEVSDVVSAFRSFMLSANTPEVNDASLHGLTTQHQVHSADGCFSRFWRFILEIQVVLRCQRCVDWLILFMSD